MTSNPNIPWARITAEGAAIVVSILMAFAIQAWWEGRQDRQDEVVVLANLLEEFRDIRANLADIQDFQAAILESAYRLAEISEDPDANVSEQELRKLLSDLQWLSSPSNFAAPVLSAVIGRGDDRLISDRNLRARLVLLLDKFAWIRKP